MQKTNSDESFDQTTLPEDSELHYVAFCDILGFSSMVASDFDRTLEIYKGLARLLGQDIFASSEVKITMYSDSILIVGKELRPVLKAVQGIWFFALASDLMLRGGIAKGRYWERKRGNDLLVVSDALVRAVKLESMVSIPAVMLADDIELADELWYPQLLGDPDAVVVTPLLHFRDRNIVNPFNRYWLLSAGNRAQSLMASNPAHKEKYLWFLALHQAVTERRQLVPKGLIDRLVREGVVGFVPHNQLGD
ncbi:hypothetical protein L2Y96_12240 [Luteibacter aegosomaticola]|uniref:hypothetical protein n=1 Tax=Luteibacter aegosomaticola TaxID=2911538 RepID=UPI001FF72163|nr:hypothetical protein [Luteibacter aegosomaticola]UPG88189.1 hypothetical protein L2Y96_12240 [Luteibacter aegosomaticola]